jgi:hypothetical protein
MSRSDGEGSASELVLGHTQLQALAPGSAGGLYVNTLMLRVGHLRDPV